MKLLSTIIRPNGRVQGKWGKANLNGWSRTHKHRELLELESFYSITTFIGGMSPPLQIRQVARLRSTTSNLQVLSPTREEHTNNPVQKPNFRGHAVPAGSKFEPGQGTYLPSL